MKNDARFFFCFTGFIGFSFFYLVACFLNQNFAFSLIHGAIGCLSFAIYGRFLLGILLKSSVLPNSSSSTITSPTLSKDISIKSIDKKISHNRKTIPKEISPTQKSFSSTGGQPMVDEKV